MRAMCVVEYGRPLEMLDVARPVPVPGEALIEVLTCGLCFSDVKTARGRMPYSSSLSMPHIAGHEVCGRVIEINRASGSSTPLRPGDKVVAYHVWGCHDCPSCRRGEEQLCTSPAPWMGFTHPGAFRDFMAVPVEYLLRVPESVPTRVAPALTCAMGTAYRAVVARGRVLPGEVAIVIGLGGVGAHAALLVTAAGARAIGVDLPEKLSAARAAGITETVEAGEGLVERIRGLVPDGADLILETTGVPSLLETGRRMLRPGGRMVAVGYHVGEDMAVSSDQLVLLEQSVLGSRYATRPDMERVIDMVARGVVAPVIDDVLPLERVNEAMERLEAGRVMGRLVLEVNG